MNEHSPIRRARIERHPAGPEDDELAVEEPLEIRLGWGPIADRRQAAISITMRTPGDDTALALGFLHGEGLIADADAVRSAGPCEAPAEGAVVRVELEPSVAVDLDRLQRHFYTTSSCGVCGKQSLEALRFQTRWSPADSPFRISATALRSLPAMLREKQPLFRSTGAIHAAARFDGNGRIISVAEDVGRHNALDKLLGRALRQGELPLADSGILVSGRASFELVQKAVMAGCPLLAAVGGPSSLAVDAAATFDMTLVGFLGAERFNVYAGAERVT